MARSTRSSGATAAGRRWLKRLQKQTRFRRWLSSLKDDEGSDMGRWVYGLLWFILILGVLMLGFVMGKNSVKPAGTIDQTGMEKVDKENPDKDKADKEKEQDKEKPGKDKDKPKE